jgi:acyl dehydratase
MPLDRAAIGRQLDTVSMRVEAGRLRFFAQAIGETDPVYTDIEAAHRAGYRDLPLPPTFLFSVGLEAPDSFGFLDDLGVDLRTILHGSQKFTYHAQAYAGDTLTVRTHIADIYEKKQGQLEFIVQLSTVTNQDDVVVADIENVTIVQNSVGAER